MFLDITVERKQDGSIFNVFINLYSESTENRKEMNFTPVPLN